MKSALTRECQTGPVSSFLVVSDPAAAKHVLRATDNPKRPLYVKGLVAEVRRLVSASAPLSPLVTGNECEVYVLRALSAWHFRFASSSR